MANTNNAIKFIHFYGTNSEWENRLQQDVYGYNIVFAQIFNNTILDKLVIYAGKDSNGNQYLFDVLTPAKMAELELKLPLLNINDNGELTNTDFKNAIEKYLGEQSLVISTIDSSIREIKNHLEWIIVEGVEENMNVINN